MKIDRAGFMRYNGGALKAAPKERFSYMIGIIGAMEIEVAGITAALTDHKTERLCGVTFHTGKLNGTDVVAAKCGVGKVNAAMCTAAMILSYAPSVVINTGVAGGIGEGNTYFIRKDGFKQGDADAFRTFMKEKLGKRFK